MKIIYNKIFLNHDTGMHPENSKRILACGDLPETDIENGEKYLNLVHSDEYIGRVKQASSSSSRLDPDTALSKDSYTAAVYAVGAAVMASQTQGFAFVRPPGHHAHPGRSSGFCLFNNMAIAVQRLVNQGKKVLIIDIDSHLGDGTMKYFYKSDQVMYCSLHQDPAFPGGGGVDEIGEDKGQGYTVNVPLTPGSGEDIFFTGFDLVLNIARKFQPDIVGVSAGFDGHMHDPLLQLRLTVNSYYRIGNLLRDNFPNLFATLEGGYNPEVFPKCVFNFLSGINGEPQEFKEEPTDSGILLLEEFDLNLEKLKNNIKAYWKF